MKTRKQVFQFLIANYLFDFLLVFKDGKLIKVLPFFGVYKERYERIYKIKEKRLERTEFKKIKKKDIDFENYSSFYKRLYEVLKEKRLYTYK
jgi:hypothetical protein